MGVSIPAFFILNLFLNINITVSNCTEHRGRNVVSTKLGKVLPPSFTISFRLTSKIDTYIRYSNDDTTKTRNYLESYTIGNISIGELRIENDKCLLTTVVGSAPCTADMEPVELFTLLSTIEEALLHPLGLRHRQCKGQVWEHRHPKIARFAFRMCITGYKRRCISNFNLVTPIFQWLQLFDPNPFDSPSNRGLNLHIDVNQNNPFLTTRPPRGYFRLYEEVAMSFREYDQTNIWKSRYKGSRYDRIVHETKQAVQNPFSLPPQSYPNKQSNSMLSEMTFQLPASPNPNAENQKELFSPNTKWSSNPSENFGPFRQHQNMVILAKTHKSLRFSSTIKQKPCLFVHGTGVIEDTYISTNYSSYWQNISLATPYCSVRHFFHYNSVENGWDNSDIYNKLCSLSSNGTGVLSNMVLFTHSMGNLLLAAAVHTNACRIDTGSVQWYSSVAPWMGSKLLYTATCFCDPTCSIHLLPRHIVIFFMKKFHYCSSNGTLNKAYQSCLPDYKSPSGVRFQDLVNTARKYISGAMCGLRALGNNLKRPNLALYFVQLFGDLETPNDGLVSFESCGTLRVGQFSNHANGTYFKGLFNHADGKCTCSDRKSCESDDSPCGWIKRIKIL